MGWKSLVYLVIVVFCFVFPVLSEFVSEEHRHRIGKWPGVILWSDSKSTSSVVTVDLFVCLCCWKLLLGLFNCILWCGQDCTYCIILYILCPPKLILKMERYKCLLGLVFFPTLYIFRSVHFETVLLSLEEKSVRELDFWKRQTIKMKRKHKELILCPV